MALPDETRPSELAAEATDRGGLLKIVPLVGRPGLRLSGEVDLATRALFVREFDAQLGATGDVHLELAELSFIDVGGVVLLATRALAFGGGRRLVLASPAAGAASHPGPPLG
jgi:hypothetical protein